VNIFHPIVRVIISWVVPFAFAAFYPASHFLREHEYRWFAAMTPIVALIIMSGAMAVFTLGTRRYRSTGS
jgi:ABC-2 type transport system permease protein